MNVKIFVLLDKYDTFVSLKGTFGECLEMIGAALEDDINYWWDDLEIKKENNDSVVYAWQVPEHRDDLCFRSEVYRIREEVVELEDNQNG
jgi:hypothetical protein